MKNRWVIGSAIFGKRIQCMVLIFCTFWMLSMVLLGAQQSSEQVQWLCHPPRLGQLSQEPLDPFLGAGLSKSAVLLAFMEFPWANTPCSCWVIFSGKGISLCLCGLAQFVTVPSHCSFQAQLIFLQREPGCTTSTGIIWVSTERLYLLSSNWNYKSQFYFGSKTNP